MSSEDQQQPPSAPEVPWTQSNGIYGKYDLHCHCGAVRFNMKLSPPLYKEETQGKEQCVAVICNCSMCERAGYIGVHPLAKDVEFTQGQELLTKYLTGSKKCPHHFCSQCGSLLWTDLTWLMENVFNMENRYTVNVSSVVSQWSGCSVLIGGRCAC